MSIRTFFALELTAKEKLSVDAWRIKALPPLPGMVPTANLHITLCFIGEMQHRQLESLFALVDEVEQSKIVAHFEHLGYWGRSRIFWLGCQPTESLSLLSRKLNKVSNKAGLRADNKDFIPHITLARRCEQPPPEAIISPNFNFEFDKFGLYQSVNKRHGVEYQCLQSWQLTPQRFKK